MSWNKLIIAVLLINVLSISGFPVQAPLPSVQCMLASAPTDSSIASSISAHDSSHTTTKLAPKTYNHNQQVILGLSMMAFIAIILSTVQSWNP